MTKYFKNLSLVLLLISISIISACDKGEFAEEELTGDAYIVDWVYRTMDTYYLWTSEMAAFDKAIEDPVDMFNSLKVSQDRFSRIYPDYDALISSLGGVSKEAGYEFTLVTTDGTEVIGIITYIKDGSPADQVGLKRGDFFFKIDDKSMTVNNYQSVLSNSLGQDHTMDYARYDFNDDTFYNQETISLSVIEISENPHYLATILTDGNKKIGYYVYNFFADNGYDAEMDAIINDFKSQGITDLVLDLRYNSGGYISSATNLASLIGSNISTSDVFYQYDFNDLLQSSESPEDLQQKFKNKTQSIGSLLNGQVYVIVGGNTASASELVINGLDPFMNVTLIGETTVGKNVGSFPIQDTENDQNAYGLLPIAFYISNSQGFNDYGAGFTPDASNILDELTVPMYELGDPREELLAQALSLITGTTTTAKKRATLGRQVLGSSLEQKSRFGNMIMDNPASK